jgi:hypothetical protein
LAQPLPKVRDDEAIQAGTPRNCRRFQRFGMRVVAILQVKRIVRCQCRSIPTMTIFKGGRPVASQSGAMGVGQLVQWIESNL